ncbi:ABC-type nitrate/sulfonate/bicarbonate transport system substrate-binding protein [Bradyrhizobium sp. USDA 4524]|uniref:ABC transporter substrate-binding protein n=1 Tax=unclassified Bradyrhizobium TaxID=2631580 RepID=UPI00209ED537|nr:MULTISPECIES: ABC transporter substrate-binding protein [unclassified Bradyrhizobium]MCP1845822.1 ABC-type nitrate/sulfonate/bicarbonate transport system substrate-binding protein [Bradyrhizobium sp. USDA 4538]MCP1906855.1 ABC-type nitrate/sulfonate/bicarbonate transport system substrate-binding protein [Bradyrhizobium sp. USDA 4537]MCP1985330.1 ABC-type nitrate/sulfonate/bicarbonate transport system substrate-binding protein [Bradyrhizobium sp. USDA 4539]
MFYDSATRQQPSVSIVEKTMRLSLVSLSLKHFVSVAALVIVAAAGMEAMTPASAAEELKTVKVFFPPLNVGWTRGFELIEVARAQGYFKKYGLDAQLAAVPWAQFSVALDSGSVDFAPFADYAYLVNARDKGLKAKVIVSSSLPFNPEAAGGQALVVRADGPIRKAQDLKGKKIGTEYPSFSGAWYALDWLAKNGVAKDEVQIVPVPDPQLQQVLDQGGVDAIIAYAPLYISLERSGYRSLFSVADIAGRLIARGGTMASDKFVSEHPDLVRAYVSAIADAAEWANAHPGDVIKLGLDNGRLEQQYLPDLYTKNGSKDYSALRWSKYALNDDTDVAFWLKLVEDAGIVPPGKYKPSDFYTNEFNPHVKESATAK